MNGILSESIARLTAPGRPAELDWPRVNDYRAIPLPQPGDVIEALRQLPQVEMPLTHRFQDGVYIREIFMPGDTWVVGHVHKTRHFNIVVSGLAYVSVSGGPVKVVQAGDVFESEAGAQKWLYVAEDMRFLTVHQNPENERDIATLEAGLLEMPESLHLAKGGMTVDEFRMSVNRALTE